MIQLPNEIWLIIIEILGESGYLRDMTNLSRTLKFNDKFGDKYRIIELNKMRNCSIVDYNKAIVQFWERTGIDDGVEPDYLMNFLNKKTKMYRTIWSHDCKKHEGKYIMNACCIYDHINKHEFKIKYKNTMIKDKRQKPTDIQYLRINRNASYNYRRNKSLIVVYSKE